MTDLRQRVPAHSLIEMLLHKWDIGEIRLDTSTNGVVVGEDAVSWYRGVLGERRVGSILEQLSDSHTVLHSVPVGTGSTDIDHVVIGRAGVFCINTKYSPGKKIWTAGRSMYVGSHKQPYVSNSMNEARRAADLLSKASGLTVPVTALLVFVDPGPITRKVAPGGSPDDPEVRVLADKHLIRVFMDRPIFSEEQTARITAAAVRPETWHRSPTTSTAGIHITREFEALETEVGSHLVGEYTVPTTISTTPAAPVSRKARKTAPIRPRESGQAKARLKCSRQATVEKLLSGLFLPVVGLALLWIYGSAIVGG
ncbi:MAG: nuclease-related domain-containing protein [Rhodoglobus sp.]